MTRHLVKIPLLTRFLVLLSCLKQADENRYTVGVDAQMYGTVLPMKTGSLQITESE